jgi:hypothetical protein
MPFRQSDADYLRKRAAEFRKLATDHETPISAELMEIASSLDARAAEIEKRPGPR